MTRAWRQRCPEDQFITMLQTMSVADVARELGLDRSKVYERKRNIELRNNTTITRTVDANPEYKAIRSITIKDGCVLVGNDAHYWPHHIPTMHRAMLMLCNRIKPSVVVMNGDAFDGASISRFASIGWEKNPSVKEELEAVVDRMDELFKASRNAEHFWTAGNHDMRFESRLAAVAPEYRGIEGIHLKDHVQGWTPCWAVEINRETRAWTEIRHREKGGIHASYRNTIESGVTLVTGHDHRADVVPYTDRRGTRYGVRTGMVAESPLSSQFSDYLEARRVNWQSACAVLTYQDGRLLMPELCLQEEPGMVQWRGEFISV